MSLFAMLGWVALALSACGVLYWLAAGIATTRRLIGAQGAGVEYPDVTIIKPLHGAYPGLRSSLASYLNQNYPSRVQIVFGVHDAADPAVAVVRALQADFPASEIDLVIDSRLYGPNRKASNLVNIAGKARHETLILSDADIVVGRDYLRTVVSALGEPGVGAVSCLYVGRDDGGLWSQLSAMAIDYHFMPNAVMGMALGMAQPCFGSTIAIRSSLLGRIGGFHAFANHLADDYEMGRAVRELGYRVAMPPMVVAHLCPEGSFKALMSHELRWSRTVRQIDPAGYAGSVITYPLPLALIGATLLGFTPLSLGLIFTILLMRVALKFGIDAVTGQHAGSWWLFPLRDVLSFTVFVGAFAVNTVGWQGRRFRVGRDGVLTHP
jgi:ceramide glucosyltransferase